MATAGLRLAFPHHGGAAAGYYQACGHITSGPAAHTSSARLWQCTMRLVWVESVRWLQNHASNMLLFANAGAQVIGHNYVINQPILYRIKQMDS